MSKLRNSHNERLIRKILLILFLLALPNIAFAEAGTTTIKAKIEFYAKKYEVPYDDMDRIVREESGYVRNARGDLHLTCKRTGRPVRARGLVQITECWWPKVTDAQADDPDFALDFLASWMSKGYCKYWSTCPIKK